MLSDYSEIEVTRKMYRSGESEYAINKTNCRLKDILELFRDTGIGKEGYSIIGQGKIDEILNEKAISRRKVFEEAAGIVKYRVRKEEAERKLAKTEENLVRVRDIIDELEFQIEPLRMQCEDAKRYFKLKENTAQSGSQRIFKYLRARKGTPRAPQKGTERPGGGERARRRLNWRSLKKDTHADDEVIDRFDGDLLQINYACFDKPR